MDPKHENLKIPEVAKLLRISRNRAYDLVASDPTFPIITIGRRLIVPRDALHEWIKDHRRDLQPK
jgi:excisionase family DNA binding protein